MELITKKCVLVLLFRSALAALGLPLHVFAAVGLNHRPLAVVGLALAAVGLPLHVLAAVGLNHHPLAAVGLVLADFELRVV